LNVIGVFKKEKFLSIFIYHRASSFCRLKYEILSPAFSECIYCISMLLPIHYRPWVTYTGELFAFLSLLALAALYLKEKLNYPLSIYR